MKIVKKYNTERNYDFIQKYKTGDLKNLFDSFIVYMFYNQWMFNYGIDPLVFQQCIYASEENGGFDWSDADLGIEIGQYISKFDGYSIEFWEDALDEKGFEIVKRELENYENREKRRRF